MLTMQSRSRSKFRRAVSRAETAHERLKRIQFGDLETHKAARWFIAWYRVAMHYYNQMLRPKP